MRITACAYRVAPGTEILYGMFNVVDGVVVQYPELFCVKVGRVYNFNAILDKPPEGVSTLDLTSALDRDDKLLIAIDYMGTGIIYVYKDYITYSPNGAPDTPTRVYKLEKSPLCLKVGRRIGGKITRFSLPDRCQKFVYTTTILKDGKEYVYTSDGVYILEDCVDEYTDELSDDAYRMAYESRVFGYVKKDNKFYLLRLINNELKKGEVIVC